MSLCLEVSAGAYRLALESADVLEILAPSAEGLTESTQVEWRERIVSVVDLRWLLETPAAKPGDYQGVVYRAGDEGDPVLLKVDRVEGLCVVGQRAFLPLAGGVKRLTDLFDGVLFDAQTEGYSYHLRKPQDLASWTCRPDASDAHRLPDQREATTMSESESQASFDPATSETGQKRKRRKQNPRPS